VIFGTLIGVTFYTVRCGVIAFKIVVSCEKIYKGPFCLKRKKQELIK
jgi:hypothetical protein